MKKNDVVVIKTKDPRFYGNLGVITVTVDEGSEELCTVLVGDTDGSFKYFFIFEEDIEVIDNLDEEDTSWYLADEDFESKEQNLDVNLTEREVACLLIAMESIKQGPNSGDFCESCNSLSDKMRKSIDEWYEWNKS